MKQEKRKEVIAPIECIRRWFLKDVYTLYLQGKSVEEIQAAIQYGSPSRPSAESVNAVIDDLNASLL